MGKLCTRRNALKQRTKGNRKRGAKIKSKRSKVSTFHRFIALQYSISCASTLTKWRSQHKADTDQNRLTVLVNCLSWTTKRSVWVGIFLVGAALVPRSVLCPASNPNIKIQFIFKDWNYWLKTILRWDNWKRKLTWNSRV